MDWFIDHWYWIAGAFLLFLFIRYMGQPSSSSTPQSSKLTSAQQDLLVKLIDALENVVDETVGRHYTRTDRQKIALGMVLIMATDDISPDKLIKTPGVFSEVMLRAIAALTANGQISTR